MKSNPEETRPLSESANAIATDLLAHVRDDLGRADAKANIVFAISGLFLGAILTACLGGEWSPQELKTLPEIFAWAAAVSMLVAILVDLLAIYPRIAIQHPDRLTFFGQVAKIDELPMLHSRLEAESKEREGTHVTEQLLVLSSIVQRKYELIQVGLWALGLAGAFAVIAALTTALLAA